MSSLSAHVKATVVEPASNVSLKVKEVLYVLSSFAQIEDGSTMNPNDACEEQDSVGCGEHIKCLNDEQENMEYALAITKTDFLEIEEGFGETYPGSSFLFDEIWSVWQDGDAASCVGTELHGREDDDEVDSCACKKLKT